MFAAASPTSSVTSGPLTAALFLRVLGAIYAVAFLSLLTQVDGLIGPRGILPATEFLPAVAQALGARGYWIVPTIFWFSASSLALQAVCASGVVAGVAIALDRFTFAALVWCWIAHLSLVSVGQAFLSFQWDSLLLETGVLAMLTRAWPQALAWLYRWLLFRLMFLSGVVKLLSGDSTWRDLTALTYHFQTQPLPNPIAWYVHQLPRGALQGMTAGTLLAESVLPFLYFAPRRARHVAALCTVAFQLLIVLTGNYTFFNLLTMALTLWLLDDATIARRLPARLLPSVTAPVTWPWIRWSLMGALLLLVTMSATTVWRTVGGATPLPLDVLADGLEPLRLTSGYGLFAVMTTTRPEIEFEGSDDGFSWMPYEFRFKPGDVRRPPPFVAPFHPRLDWQLWFAALNDAASERWVVSFAHRLLDGSPAVVGLLAPGPWTRHPPRFIRATLYDYRFTTWDEASRTGAWWTRQPLRSYLPTLTLENGALTRVE